MSIEVENDVWANAPVKGSALLVLVALANNADTQSRTAWPSNAYIAQKTRLSERQVRRIIGELEAGGQITVTRRGGRHRVNVYRIATFGQEPEKGDILSPFLEVDDLPERGTPTTRKGDISGQNPDIAMSPGTVIENSQEPSGRDTGAVDQKPSPNGKADNSLEGFDDWYALYPHKVGRGSAERAWRTLRPDADLQRVMKDAIVKQCTTVFKDREKRYIPHPATWLNGKRWLDDLPEQEDDDWRARMLAEDEDPEDAWARVGADIDAVIEATYREKGT